MSSGLRIGSFQQSARSSCSVSHGPTMLWQHVLPASLLQGVCTSCGIFMLYLSPSFNDLLSC